jgi:photosynthetic reaction center cytochrome c subunit
MSRSKMRVLIALATLAGAALLAGCERPPMNSVQVGYRGTGEVQIYNPRTVADLIPANQPPEAAPAAPSDGPKARDVFKNVQVLGDLSVAEFTRHMTAITSWVAPAEGCGYCHNLANLAEDSKYTKVVARKMIQMTQKVNTDWKPHVADTGVTCYTCHRGQHIPQQVWFTAPPQDKRGDFIGNRNAQNMPLTTVGMSSLPYDPFSTYLKNTAQIRVAGTTALPTGHKDSIQDTEATYGLMMHMSQSLGVNCTYCHNTRSFGSWTESSPKRTTAWYGIRMVRDLNLKHLEPLTATFPESRRGPMGDVAKINCSTCHQGAYKPLYGAAMAKDYPELLKVVATQTVASLPPPIAEASRSVLYFGVGSAVLGDDQAKGLAQLIVKLNAEPKLKATISGYHSAAGTLAQNQELAKQRAFTVRDSLLAGGVKEARVVLEKPQQTEANISGEDPSARRVEVTVK